MLVDPAFMTLREAIYDDYRQSYLPATYPANLGRTRQRNCLEAIVQAVWCACCRCYQDLGSLSQEIVSSRKLGLLLWMLSNGELSARVKGELQKLCSALDSRAFDAAMQIQVPTDLF